jgi:GNAT superfamily N-acetyltransferase
LRQIPTPVLPNGYSVCKATLGEFTGHISSCYDYNCITEQQLLSYAKRPVYEEKLWLSVRCDKTVEIVATGIAELERTIGEVSLEWIRVFADHRRNGLGHYLVTELLQRLKHVSNFVTGSGQCNNPACRRPCTAVAAFPAMMYSTFSV